MYYYAVTFPIFFQPVFVDSFGHRIKMTEMMDPWEKGTCGRTTHRRQRVQFSSGAQKQKAGSK